MLPYAQQQYHHVGRASDLKGKDRIIYRLFEMIPGVLAWGTIGLVILLSYRAPVVAAFFIIIFDLFWFLKTVYLSFHLRYNWLRLKDNLKRDWDGLLKELPPEKIYHMVMYPFYKESYEVLHKSVASIAASSYDKKNIIVVLGAEARAGEEHIRTAERLVEEYQDTFLKIFVTIHPANIPGELAGKGSNITYSAREAGKILKELNLDHKKVIVSAFDADTVVYPGYFSCLTYNFLTAARPLQSSFQPVPLYHNNVWHSPAVSRVVAGASTFWQMIQQERPEKLTTFSSHAISYYTLEQINFWQVNMVSEDSRIYWNALMAYDGEYDVIPIAYPVSMDANLGATFWQTLKNIYKQHRRWAWGSENIPYILFNFMKNKKISLTKKIKVAFVQLEGYWSLATNPIFIFLLGWLPLVLGNKSFNRTVLAYNLPTVTRDLMILSMVGLVFGGIVFWSLLPSLPDDVPPRRRAYMIVQWILVPITILIFGAIPGLDAQSRLLFGRYMGFWVTPKHRKSKKQLRKLEKNSK